MFECARCGKEIDDEEYVVNWGSCGKCFDNDYNEYLKTQEGISPAPEEEIEF